MESSTLELYRRLLALRSSHGLGTGTVSWLTGFPESVIAFQNSGVAVITNLGATAVPVPPGEVLASSGPLEDGQLPGDATVWLTLAS